MGLARGQFRICQQSINEDREVLVGSPGCWTDQNTELACFQRWKYGLGLWEGGKEPGTFIGFVDWVEMTGGSVVQGQDGGL